MIFCVGMLTYTLLFLYKVPSKLHVLTMMWDHVMDIVRCHNASSCSIFHSEALCIHPTTKTSAWALSSWRGRSRTHCVTVLLLLSLVLCSSILEPHLNDTHVQTCLLGQLFPNVSWRLGASTIRCFEDFELLCTNCCPRPFLIAVCFTCNEVCAGVGNIVLISLN